MRKPPALTVGLSVGAFLIVLAASLPPLAGLAENRLFSAHMLQHLLLGDIAPLLVAIALRPRGLSPHPLLALTAWCAALAVWHVPRVYDLALTNEAVHQLQHATFFAAGLLLWSAILSERAPLGWRLGAVAGLGLAGAALGNVFLWASDVVYKPYLTAPRAWGLSPMADQQLGGAIMLAEGAAVTIAVFGWLVLRSLGESEGAAAL